MTAIRSLALFVPLAFVADAAARNDRAADVARLSARALRGDLPMTGRATRLPRRAVQAARCAGELGLNGWLTEGMLFLSDAADPEAFELLAQVGRAREAVIRCRPARSLPTSDAPLLLFHLRCAGFYRAVVDHFQASLPDMREFLESARMGPGFELADPLLCVVCVAGQPTTTRSNLLVHLATHALFDAAFGGAPEWLREGFALDVEVAACGRPEAFCRSPRRDLPEHAPKWNERVAVEWKDADAATFDAALELGRDGFDESAAWRALGVVHWLRERHPLRFADLASVLADAQAAAAAGPVVDRATEAARLTARGLDSVLGERWRQEFLASLRRRN